MRKYKKIGQSVVIRCRAQMEKCTEQTRSVLFVSSPFLPIASFFPSASQWVLRSPCLHQSPINPRCKIEIDLPGSGSGSLIAHQSVWLGDLLLVIVSTFALSGLFLSTLLIVPCSLLLIILIQISCSQTTLLVWEPTYPHSVSFLIN